MEKTIIAKNTFYQVLARAATAFIGFLITIIIASKFGVLGFGDFVKVTSFVAIFYLIIDFGLNAFFLQEKTVGFKSLFYLRLALSLFVFILLNIFALFLPYSSILNSGFSDFIKFSIFVFSFNLFFQGIIISAAAKFQKNLNYYPYMVGVIIGAVINLFAVFLFVFLNFSIFYMFVAFLFSNLATALLLLYFAKEKILPPKIDIEFSKSMIIKSLPLGLMLIFNLIYFRIDILLLSFFKQSSDVGIYGLSYKFFDFLIALPLFLSNAVYPFLIKEKNDTKKLLITTKKYFFIFLTLSIIILIPFWFVSPLFELINKGFSPAIISFRILLLSLPLFFVTSLLQWVLITIEKQKFLMYAYVFTALVNIFLNIIFIPKYSYLASAWITVICEAIIFSLLSYKIFFVKKISEQE